MLKYRVNKLANSIRGSCCAGWVAKPVVIQDGSTKILGDLAAQLQIGARDGSILIGALQTAGIFV